MIRSGFDETLRTKADKTYLDNVEKKLERRIDILEYEVIGRQDRRLEIIEDDIRVIKSNLNI